MELLRNKVLFILIQMTNSKHFLDFKKYSISKKLNLKQKSYTYGPLIIFLSSMLSHLSVIEYPVLSLILRKSKNITLTPIVQCKTFLIMCHSEALSVRDVFPPAT